MTDSQSSNIASSLSGTLAQLLTTLHSKAPLPYKVISGEGYEFFYNIQTRGMTRVRCGTPVAEVSGYKEDDLGRIVVQTIDGEAIRIEKDRVISLGFH